jgi:hypothetical protein
VISTGECNRFTHSPEVMWDDGEKEQRFQRLSAR